MTYPITVLCGIPFTEQVEGVLNGWLPSADITIHRKEGFRTIVNGNEIFWDYAPRTLEEAARRALAQVEKDSKKFLATMATMGPENGPVYLVLSSPRMRARVLAATSDRLGIRVKCVETGEERDVKVYEVLPEHAETVPLENKAVEDLLDYLRKQVAANCVLAITSKTHRGATDAYMDILQRVEALVRKP